MKTIIMAGGRGLRISSVAPDIPKPLIQIEGIPVLEREIICLRDQGFNDIIITVSYLAEQIIEYFGNGRNLGVRIEYYVENKPLGNAGALLKIKNILTEPFLLLNADSVFDVDFNRFIDFHYSHNGLATIFTHPNSHPYDSGLIIANIDGCVQQWLTKEDIRPKWYKNRVNAGLHIINPTALEMYDFDRNSIGDIVQEKQVKIDLDRHILKPLCGTGSLYCYDSPEYVKDMGTPDRYNTVCKDFYDGIVQSKNLKNKQKAIFLDRDGTINKYVGFLKNIDDFELLPGVSEAVKRINSSGYLAIVVTNQPVLARGEVTYSKLEEIHNKMETLLGNEGAYLDAIYYCPHHPHKGYAGEIIELKVECNCRKPKPGMLLKAAQQFNIDLSQSWMIGDRESDVQAGHAAMCKTALIGEGDFGQNITVKSLFDFCNRILKI